MPTGELERLASVALPEAHFTSPRSPVPGTLPFYPVPHLILPAHTNGVGTLGGPYALSLRSSQAGVPMQRPFVQRAAPRRRARPALGTHCRATRAVPPSRHPLRPEVE